jgi:hypothetical protein
LIGKGSSEKKRLEGETGGKLTIPPRNDTTSETILMSGSTQTIVATLRHAVDKLIATTALNPTVKLAYTHFLAFPVGNYVCWWLE